MDYGTEEQKREIALHTYKDALYFVLFQLKNGLTWDCLGVLFSMDGSNACRNFHKYLSVLELTLFQEGALPRRSFQSAEEFKKYLNADREVIGM